MNGRLFVVLISLLVSAQSWCQLRGDLNSDGMVDVTDVGEVIDIVLGKSTNAKSITTYNVKGVSFNMVRVEGGTFTMGATPEQGSDATPYENPAHQVTLSSYSIGQMEVTQMLWMAVMGVNPSRFTSHVNLPVEQVSWDDCQVFIARLNELTGEHFRLPTEAEWEFAARGGIHSRGTKYAGGNDVELISWFSENSDNMTHLVGQKQPNELGLYDMSGNVWEWVNDWSDYYPSSPQTNPTGPSEGTERMTRGGSFFNIPWYIRVSARHGRAPSNGNSDIGLRLAL